MLKNNKKLQSHLALTTEYFGVIAYPLTPRCASLTRGYPRINPSDF